LAGIPVLAGTITIRFISRNELPAGRKATFPRIVVADRPQKTQEPRRFRVNVGGDRIDYPGKVATKTADMATVKLHLNSVISTPEAKFMTLDIKYFYLKTPMKRAEYMYVALKDIPQALILQYGLNILAIDGYVCTEITKGMYGLPQASILANDDLVIHLADQGYVQSEHTPGLFIHNTRPISFGLVVDDFGVKYVGETQAQHLVDVLKHKYTITIHWTGDLYIGLHLRWDYDNRTVDISMPDCVTKALQRFEHPTLSKPQHVPHIYTPQQYGAMVQLTLPPDTYPALSTKQVERLQLVMGTAT
jgi:hypothetical protein